LAEETYNHRALLHNKPSNFGSLQIDATTMATEHGASDKAKLIDVTLRNVRYIYAYTYAYIYIRIFKYISIYAELRNVSCMLQGTGVMVRAVAAKARIQFLENDSHVVHVRINLLWFMLG